MSFNENYNEIKLLAKNEISLIENIICRNINTKEPLNSLLKGFLISPSKRIRSVLAIIYSKAVGENLSQKQLDLLSVIELIHNASLIHDDVIDKSNLRRGHKTISAEFDNRLAVISGDYVLSIAMELLANIGNFEVIQKISQTIRQMCQGEIYQNFNRYKRGTIEEYIEKTKNKTAYLFQTALVCTMMLSNNSHNLNKIGQFGLNVGMAFQIRDDILNMIYNDNSKPYNNDFEDGIYNAPVILGNKEDNYASGIEKTKLLLDNYLEDANNFVSILNNNEYKYALAEFLELLKDV